MRETVSSLQVANLSGAAFLKQSAQWKSSVMGALYFATDAAAGPIDELGIPCMRVPLRRLDAGQPICETWHSSRPVTQGHHGTVHYSHDDDVLFGVMALPESLFEAGANRTPLHQAADSAYRQVFSLLGVLRYPHLFRFWNYFPDINGHSFGLERYRQFNLGRQDAFVAQGQDMATNLPAACALGSAPGPLTVAFLAGRVAPLHIENPRQISAYQYPQQYGPRSPMFSRASLVRLRQEEVLLVSGTASIVGHASLHPTDVVAQTRETVSNIKSVLAEANRLAGGPGFELAGMNYKVYVRHAANLPQIRSELARCAGAELKAVYLQADVCRKELLLEIEASAAQPLARLSSQGG